MENIHVVFTSDENYVQHTGVAITSLLANSKSPNQITINFIDGGVSTKNLALLDEIVTKYGATFIVHNINNQEYENFYVSGHITKAAYYRLAIPDILPPTVEKAIYLDPDLIMRHDIKELWENDISDYYIGAVINVRNKEHPNWQAELGIPLTEPYFNSGVLLINTRKWREEKIKDRVMHFINSRDSLRFHDQDALNAVLWGKWLVLHPKWNTHKALFNQYYKFNRKKSFGLEFIEAVKDPYIVHFNGPIKPWHYACALPYTQDYYKYLAMTPWKNYHPIDINLISFGKRCEWVLKRKIRGWFVSFFKE